MGFGMRNDRFTRHKSSLIAFVLVATLLTGGYAFAQLQVFVLGGARVMAALTSLLRVGFVRQGMQSATVQKVTGALLGLSGAYAGCSSLYLNGCKWSGLGVANDLGTVVDKATNQNPVKLGNSGTVFGYSQGQSNGVTVQLSGGAFSTSPVFDVMPSTYSSILSATPFRVFPDQSGKPVSWYYYRTSSSDSNLRFLVAGTITYSWCGGTAPQPANTSAYLGVGDQIAQSALVGAPVTSSTYPQMSLRTSLPGSAVEAPARSGCYTQSYALLYEYRSGTSPNTVPPPYWSYPWVDPASAAALAPTGALDDKLDDSFAAALANRVWDFASSKGVVPHRTPESSITPADAAAVRTGANSASYPTVKDLLGVNTGPIDFSKGLEDGAVSTPGTGTGTGTLPGSGTSVDLGEYTQHEAPELSETPVLGMLTEPLAHSLQQIVPEFPSVGASCPQPSFDVNFAGQNHHYVMDGHCYWFARFGPELSLAFKVIWVLLALFIFLSA